MNATMVEIEIGLRELRTQAPDPVLRDVLVGCGLADAYVRATSPIGDLFVAAGVRGVTRVTFAEGDRAFERDYERQFGRPAYQTHRLPHHLRPLVGDLLKCSPKSMRFDLRGCSEFERAVLMKALEIPPGEVRPYGWIAREIGKPKAVRAVGTALGNNPVPLLIPCHRVVRSDGTIGEYGLGGPDRKRTLLTAEGLDPAELERLARRGIRYVGSDTTNIYCFPTCRHARRVTEPHRVQFRSAREAEGTGYRGCLICRPGAA
jgi:O-6-methylguanine DNA methyltransferase